jgi:hypothetical protein
MVHLCVHVKFSLSGIFVRERIEGAKYMLILCALISVTGEGGRGGGGRTLI